jgi:hypothetical protein
MNDRDETKKPFFRFLATSLNFSGSLQGSTLFYGVSDATSESYAYYRKVRINLKCLNGDIGKLPCFGEARRIFYYINTPGILILLINMIIHMIY